MVKFIQGPYNAQSFGHPLGPQACPLEERPREETCRDWTQAPAIDAEISEALRVRGDLPSWT